uniref:Uncharacterized protein n=1 Tax=Sus scrofa TaxID=9823 RepID=A0A8W4FFI5_PIG
MSPGPGGLLTSAPTSRLWLALPVFCFLWQPVNAWGWGRGHRGRETRGMKAKVRGSSEENSPVRRKGIQNLRKHPSGFPWGLFTLKEQKFQHLQESACEIK